VAASFFKVTQKYIFCKNSPHSPYFFVMDIQVCLRGMFRDGGGIRVNGGGGGVEPASIQYPTKIYMLKTC